MKKLVLTLAATAVATFASAETKWDLPTGYGVNTFQTKNAQQFAADVNRLSGGKLTITLHPGGSLFKQPEIKRAIQAGMVPAGEFIISGLANENPIFGVDSIPFLATSYGDAKRLLDASKPVQQKVFAQQGIKMLFSVPWPGQSLYSVGPINSAADFKGTKMRAYNPATTKIAQMLGASPVTIQLPELGQALATGAAQNFLTSSASGADGKLYEQTKYFYPVNGWLPCNVTAVSMKAFNALDKDVQEAVLKAAAMAEQRGWVESEKVNTDSIAVLRQNGMNIAEPSDSVRQALASIGEKMTAEWAEKAGADGQAILSAYKR